MKIFIGADYLGFELKNKLIGFLIEMGYEVVDEGAYEMVAGDDFNDPAVKVSLDVRENPGAMGILVCGSGHGMTIQANRFKGIRAALCDNAESARAARISDDTNVLCLAGNFISEENAHEVVRAFLTTDFEPLERRIRRINRLDEREDYD